MPKELTVVIKDYFYGKRGKVNEFRATSLLPLGCDDDLRDIRYTKEVEEQNPAALLDMKPDIQQIDGPDGEDYYAFTQSYIGEEERIKSLISSYERAIVHTDGTVEGTLTVDDSEQKTTVILNFSGQDI